MRGPTAIIPVFNNPEQSVGVLGALLSQTLVPELVNIIDSSTDDRTAKLVEAMTQRFSDAGMPILYRRIAVSDFRHSATRSEACLALADVASELLLLTQDALPDPNCVYRLMVSLMSNDNAGCVVARQVPRVGASARERYYRNYRYPSVPRTIAPSNTATLYRASALREVGYFGTDMDFGEDMIVGARLKNCGWQVLYEPHAVVWHSHRLSVAEVFSRAAKTGRISGTLNLRPNDAFGRGGARRYVTRSIAHIGRNSPLELPLLCLDHGAQLLGFLAGRACSGETKS